MIVQITHGPTQIPFHMSPYDKQVFDHCAIAGEVWAGWVNGELEAVWGVIPPSYMSTEAYLWLWNLPVKHPILLARYSRKVIATLHERWPNLHGHCHVGSHRWLCWLGAEFGPSKDGNIPFVIHKVE